MATTNNKKEVDLSLVVPLVITPEAANGYVLSANTTWLSGIFNFYPIKDNESEVYLKSRPALYRAYTTVQSAARPILGAYYWPASSKTYFVFYDGANYKLYENSTSIATLGAITETKVQFVPWSYNGTSYLLLFTGAEGWYITTGGVATQITDADFPSPHVPSAVVMDGYVFLAKKNTADIYNSDLGSVTSWTASAFITAEREPDSITALRKVDGNIVCLKETTTEVFYNAGTPAPNSPLARNNAYFYKIGAGNYKGVTNIGNKIFFVGKEFNSSAWRFYKFENYQITDVSGPTFVNLLGYSWSTSTGGIYSFVYDGQHFVHMNTNMFFSSTTSPVTSVGSTQSGPASCHYSDTTGLYFLWAAQGRGKAGEMDYWGVDAYSDPSNPFNVLVVEPCFPNGSYSNTFLYSTLRYPISAATSPDQVGVFPGVTYYPIVAGVLTGDFAKNNALSVSACRPNIKYITNHIYVMGSGNTTVFGVRFYKSQNSIGVNTNYVAISQVFSPNKLFARIGRAKWQNAMFYFELGTTNSTTYAFSMAIKDVTLTVTEYQYGSGY